MKRIVITYLFVLSVIFTLQAQDYPKPDFKNQPVLFKDGAAQKLERQTAEMKVKVKALGYGGTQQEISVPGGTSPVRTSRKPSFLIWVDEGVDLDSLLIIKKKNARSKKRNIPIAKVSAFASLGARGKSMAGKYHVPYEIEKVSEDVYKITPSADLLPKEEYALYNPEKTQAQQVKIFLFGTN